MRPRIYINVTPKMKMLLPIKAKDENISVSEYVRRALKEYDNELFDERLKHLSPHLHIPIAPIARIVNNRTGEVRRFLMNNQYTAFVPRQ